MRLSADNRRRVAMATAVLGVLAAALSMTVEPSDATGSQDHRSTTEVAVTR